MQVALVGPERDEARGQPIVLLANHPTTGGYPVVAVVEPDDLWRVGQARPGSRLRFRWASH